GFSWNQRRYSYLWLCIRPDVFHYNALRCGCCFDHWFVVFRLSASIRSILRGLVGDYDVGCVHRYFEPVESEAKALASTGSGKSSLSVAFLVLRSVALQAVN